MNTHKEPTRLEQELQNLIEEFKEFNISNQEEYPYDFLGFSEWLEFEKGVKAQELAPLKDSEEHEHVWMDSMRGTECLKCHRLEPTTPSQIEEEKSKFPSVKKCVNQTLAVFFLRMDSYANNLEGEDYRKLRDMAYQDCFEELQLIFREPPPEALKKGKE